MKWYELAPQWMSAIGTILAVVVALFYKSFKDWYNRPKINMTCPNSKQCREEIKQSTESSDVSSEMQIRIKLENTGKYIANHATLLVDTYYKKRDKDDTYIKTEFTPIQMRDYRNSKPAQIVPHLIYLFNIASVRLYDDMTEQDGIGKSKQFYKLYLLGAERNQELGRGTFVIPLKFYSSRVDVKISYLKIYWESDDFSTDTEHFDCQILTEKEFKKLNIAE